MAQIEVTGPESRTSSYEAGYCTVQYCIAMMYCIEMFGLLPYCCFQSFLFNIFHMTVRRWHRHLWDLVGVELSAFKFL